MLRSKHRAKQACGCSLPLLLLLLLVLLAAAADHTSLATISIHSTPSNSATSFTLRLRIPAWASSQAKVSLLASDTHSDQAATPGAYFEISR